MLRTEKLVLCGVLTALAAIFSYVEALIPFSFGVPGIKLGLANVAIVFALYSLGFRFALLINFMRILLVSFLFTNVTMALYSLAGACLSLVIMEGLRRIGRFSLIGVSAAGGVFHNIGQLLIAVWVVKTIGLFGYLPALIAAGTATGVLIGFITGHVLRILPSGGRGAAGVMKK